MRSIHLLASLALVGLVACGGGSSDPRALNDEGAKSLATNPSDALAKFDQAIAAVGEDSSNDQYITAHLGAIDAKIRLGEASAAKDDFLGLAGKHPELISANDFSAYSQKLAGKDPLAALEVADAGMQRFPESPGLVAMIDRLKAMAASSGNDEMTSALQGLGYLGD